MSERDLPDLDLYEGPDPFVFISYAHADSARVFPIIQLLQATGFRIFFDQHLTVGNVWQQELEEKISNCSHFLLFLSPNAFDSPYIFTETSIAREDGKPIVPILLEPCEIPRGTGWRMNIINLQWLDVENPNFEAKLVRAITPRERETYLRDLLDRLGLRGAALGAVEESIDFFEEHCPQEFGIDRFREIRAFFCLLCLRPQAHVHEIIQELHSLLGNKSPRLALGCIAYLFNTYKPILEERG